MTLPRAYFITFRTYGTWLHGDERGSVAPGCSRFGTPTLGKDDDLLRRDEGNLAHEPVVLEAIQRKVVEESIRGVCEHRGWRLYALNVRTNHVHLVAIGRTTPEGMMNAFKAWATRRLVEAGLMRPDQRVWSRHGSTRYLWTWEKVEQEMKYVVDGQGPALQEE